MQVPLFRFLLLLIAGILVANYFPELNLIDSVLVAAILLTVFLIFYVLRKTVRQPLTIAFLAYSFTFLFGYALTSLKSPDRYTQFQYPPAIELRESMLHVFSGHGIEGNEYGVLASLTLGDRVGVDKQLVKDYAASGVIHILSVSGLHVGIVFIGFNFLLSFLDRNKKFSVLKLILLLLLIWFYTLLTGLSAPACRAATMLSFVILGKAKAKSISTTNILVASAFFLLCIDPFMLFQIGFQLSYAAVFGIVYLHPKIKGWYDSNYWLMRQVWLIVSISIAAQLFTFPLSVFYFHQFPNYFLLANLLVIPLSSFIIYVAVLLLMVFWIPYFSDAVAWILNGSVQVLNNIVTTVHTMPYAITKSIYVTIIDVVLLYFLMLAATEWLMHAKSKYLFGLLSALILLTGEHLISSF